MKWTTLAAAGLLGALLIPGRAGAETVEGAFRGLSSGPLRDARLVALPAGIVARIGRTTVTAREVEAQAGRAPATVRADAQRNLFYVLERRASRILLASESAAWARGRKPGSAPASESERVRAYLAAVTSRVTVSEAEGRAYYAANRDAMGGASYAQAASEIGSFLLDQKREEAVQAHLGGLSARTPVEVDAAWTRSKAAPALANAVDRARRAGKPALIEFGAPDCPGCRRMAPVLAGLRRRLAGRCAIVSTNVRQEQMVASRYGIGNIPVQVFVDRTGREVSRHVGYLPERDLMARLAAIGVR